MQVEQRRGTLLETVHRVHVAVVDADGALVARAGDPSFVTFWRSAAKPFQAMAMVAEGAADRYGLTREDLALCCASHSSEPAQVERVRELLQKIGCSERDLRCGPHPPLSDAVAKDYEQRGVHLTAVYSNCSGKHAGMLALGRHRGWPPEDYQRLEHPVQQRCWDEVARWTGLARSEIGTAVDGCGVVCFSLPLKNMAWAYARLGNAELKMQNAESSSQRSVFPTGHSAISIHHSALRITEAMLRHPELIAGDRRPCTEMMRAHPGRVIAKVGAEGVYSALLVTERLGVSLKVEDGHGGAAALAMAAVLEQLGLRPRPASLQSRPNYNTRGELVGELRVIGEVEQ